MTDSELIEHMHARGWRTEAIDVPMIREACKALQASASAEPVQEPDKWIFDPHDIEQGMMLNPAWLKLHGLTAREAIAASPVTAARKQEAGCAACVTCGQPWPEASATGAELVYAECYVCGRPMDGLSEDDCHCFHRKELATPTTSTTGKVDADEAFEDLYKVSSRDPSNREDLGFWRAGRVAGQRALPRPVDASRVRECCGSPVNDKQACGSGNAKCETQAQQKGAEGEGA